MQYTETIGEGLALQMTVARVVSRYAEGKNLPRKLTDLLKDLLFENMKEGVTDEEMEYLLETSCEDRRLDPEDVMAHFSAITESLQQLLREE